MMGAVGSTIKDFYWKDREKSTYGHKKTLIKKIMNNLWSQIVSLDIGDSKDEFSGKLLSNKGNGEPYKCYEEVQKRIIVIAKLNVLDAHNYALSKHSSINLYSNYHLYW